MADVAPAGVERRDKSTESPAKYAGNEDGEKSDEDHRGKMVKNSHEVFLGFGREGIDREFRQQLLATLLLRSKAVMVGSQESLPDP